MSGDFRRFAIAGSECGEFLLRIARIEVLEVERRDRELAADALEVRGLALCAVRSHPRVCADLQQLEVAEVVRDHADERAVEMIADVDRGRTWRQLIVDLNALRVEVGGTDDDAPPAVRTDAPAPSSARTQISPKAFVGPTTTIPSRPGRASPRATRRSRYRPWSGRTCRRFRRAGRVIVDHLRRRARPPAPITNGAGSGLPLETTLIDGVMISVVVRLALASPPGRISVTWPPTRERLADADGWRARNAGRKDGVGRGDVAVAGGVLHREAVRADGCDDARARRYDPPDERRDVRRALDLVDPSEERRGREREDAIDAPSCPAGRSCRRPSRPGRRP